MACLQHAGILAGAACAASVLASLPALANADDVEAAARAAIAANCERCHPPLPDGGWEVMTLRPHDREEMAFLLYRMEEEYSAFPSDDEAAAIIAFLSGFE
ncbi:hypothetical protein RGUI_3161 [Rhodovulum sp. P5]|uniref:hypothetical protein n=1 Tax=Rhodovulum sp. P5 TaxID=1564506 RepID=UPI0009C2D177|nr:hypothetical protein [Rhodovulum sp. P5]ARE41302.1 hypothetical protein RGUI_3161 [Rhodovulum sp. P5]